MKPVLVNLMIRGIAVMGNSIILAYFTLIERSRTCLNFIKKVNLEHTL